MLEKVFDWIEKYHLICSGDHIVVAFSGGPDSLALLHALIAFRKKIPFHIVAVHVNHMFRGAESDNDEEFVKKHCYKWGIICYTKSINVPAYITKSRLSPEEAARKLRYEYLREVAHHYGNNTKIATGHHRDDQAETVLMNLMRGAGSAGLRGMRPMNGDIIRPLLCVSRQEIEQFCQEMKVEPRIDSTNFSSEYLRNRVRWQVLPQLEKTFSKGVKDALCRTSQLVGDEHDFILSEVERLWPQIFTEGQDGLVFNTAILASLHIAVLRELFRKAIEKCRGHLQGISYYHVENAIAFSQYATVGKVFQLPGGVVVRKGYGKISFVYPQKVQSIPERIPVKNKIIVVPGETKIPELNIVLYADILRTALNQTLSPSGIILDYQQLELPLFIRTRTAGDKFCPKGMKHSKKLKDFLIDLKVPYELRDTIPLLCNGDGQILWVVGYRTSELCLPTQNTVDFLKITLMK